MNRLVVVYVEDEPDDVLFMQMAFRRTGISPELFAIPDGKKAIETLASWAHGPVPGGAAHVAAVLIDINLPLISGFEVLAWMRSQPAYKLTPALIVSSSGREDDRSKAMALGANGYWIKPSSGASFTQIAEDVRRRWPMAMAGFPATPQDPPGLPVAPH